MIQSVQKAMQILSVISNGKNEPVTLAQIAQITGFPKPTCAHIVETLCQSGYIEHVSRSEGYRLGLAVYHLTRYGRYGEELIALCRPVLKWMESNSQAAALLTVIRNQQKFIIDYVDTGKHLFPEYQQVRTDDIYRTAGGRVILAHMDRDQLMDIYHKYGAPPQGVWEGVTSFDTLCRELERLRTQPVVAVRNSSAIGNACALMHGASCLGAVGLGWHVTPDAPATAERHRKIERVLVEGTREIQRRLQYHEV